MIFPFQSKLCIMLSIEKRRSRNILLDAPAQSQKQYEGLINDDLSRKCEVAIGQSQEVDALG